MLSNRDLFDLKNEYGNIYVTQVRNVSLVFRELTFREYDEVLFLESLPDVDYSDVEDYILLTSILYPEDYDIYKLPAGTVSVLSEQVLSLSGFSSAKIAKRVLEGKRIEANEVKNLMKAFVLSTISSYSPEDLDNMSFSILAEKVALSEKIIEIKQGSNHLEPNNMTLQLIDPEEELENQKKAKEKYDKAKPQGAASIDDPIANKLWRG